MQRIGETEKRKKVNRTGEIDLGTAFFKRTEKGEAEKRENREPEGGGRG